MRKNIKSKKNFYIVSKNKAVMDNMHTSFTFGKEEFVKYRRNIRKGTGVYTSETLDERGFPRDRLPIEDRWSARFFDLKDVFTEPVGNSHVFEIDDFYNLNSWAEYKNYISSDFSSTVQRPTKELFSYREFNRVAADRD